MADLPEGGDSPTWVWHDPAHFRHVPRPRLAWWWRLWNFTKAVAVVAMAGASQQGGGDLTEGGSGIKAAWMLWQEMRDGPDGPGVAEGSGLDLSSIDRDLTETFRGYFADCELSETAFENLVRGEGMLARVVPRLSGRDRQYFAMARAITRGILEQVTDDRPPWAAG